MAVVYTGYGGYDRTVSFEAYQVRVGEIMKAKLLYEVEVYNKSLPAVVTVALDANRRSWFASLFPELRISWEPVDGTSASVFEAGRQLMNQLALVDVRTTCESVVSYGASGQTAVCNSGLSIHPEVDIENAAAVAVATADMGLLQERISVVSEALGLDPSETALPSKACEARSTCFSHGDAVVVDGTQYAWTPAQFLRAMAIHSSSVGYYLYHAGCGDVTGDTDLGPLFGRPLYVETQKKVVEAWADVHGSVTGGAERYEFVKHAERSGFVLMRVTFKRRFDNEVSRLVKQLDPKYLDPMVALRTWQLTQENEKVHGVWKPVVVVAPQLAVRDVMRYLDRMDADDFGTVELCRRYRMRRSVVTLSGDKLSRQVSVLHGEASFVLNAVAAVVMIRRYYQARLPIAWMVTLDRNVRFKSARLRNQLAYMFHVGELIRFKYNVDWASPGLSRGTLATLYGGALDQGSASFTWDMDGPVPVFGSLTTLLCVAEF